MGRMFGVTRQRVPIWGLPVKISIDLGMLASADQPGRTDARLN